MIIARIPFVPSTLFIMLSICSGFGLCKMAPVADAVNIPFPTKPENDGSWPLPPPDIRETWGGWFGFKKTTLLLVSTETLGFVNGRDWMALSMRMV